MLTKICAMRVKGGVMQMCGQIIGLWAGLPKRKTGDVGAQVNGRATVQFWNSHGWEAHRRLQSWAAPSRVLPEAPVILPGKDAAAEWAIGRWSPEQLAGRGAWLRTG